MNTPLISVVTPTKNRLRLLIETMDSVAAQSLADWEHIIVDDGSDDGTPEEVRKRAASDSRIRYIQRSGPVGGGNVCRNLGLRESRADLTVFLDSDDLLRPNCLERRLAVMRDNKNLDFSVFRAGAFVKVPNDLSRLYHDQMVVDDLLAFLSHDCLWQTTGPIWRRAFLHEIDGFDEALLAMQDLEMHVRAICKGGKYLKFPDIDHDIRWEHDYTRVSIRNIYEPRYIEASKEIRARLLRLVRDGGLLTWSRKRALLGLSFEASERWLRAKRLGAALAVWVQESRASGESATLRVSGLVMILLLYAGSLEKGFASRIVNKWKGIVRFRQEPALIDVRNGPAGAP